MRLLLTTFLIIVFQPISSYSQWNEITNHPFTDTLWSIFMDSNKSLITGNEGVLHSPDNLSTITEISNFYSSADSVIYENSIFYDCFIDDYFDLWVCGRDTSTNKGVVFYSDGNSNWMCKLQSSLTSKFNDIEVLGGDIICVGNNTMAQFDIDGYFEMEDSIGLSGSEYYALAKGDYYSVMTLSSNKLSEIEANVGTVQNYNVYTEYSDFVRTSLSPIEFALTKDNQLYHSEEPFINWQRYSAIDDIDTFNCIDKSFDGLVIGSENGVYFFEFSNEIGEKSVGSEGYFITGLWTPPYANNEVYAVGADGKLIVNSDVSQNTFPFVDYDYDPTYCLDSSNVIENLGKATYDYDWYVDNNYITSSYDLNYTFTTTGTHSIKLVGSNGIHSDSILRSFTVIPPPSATLNYSVSDTLICHEGTVDFTFGTEQGMSYGLKRRGSNYPDYIFYGNGDTMTVTTDLITDTTFFELYAGYPSESCYVLHDLDTIFTQHPKSKFYNRIINAEEGEDIGLYEQSERADTIEWLLTPYIPTLIDGIHYETNYINTYGSQSIGMVAHTYEGCTDTLIKEDAVFIIDTMEYTDVCFSLLLQEDDYNLQNTLGGPPFFDLESDSSGAFYVAGSGNVNIPSNLGASIDTILGSGHFLAKYNKYGALKWVHRLVDQNTGNKMSQIDNLEILDNGSLELTVTRDHEMNSEIHSTDGEIYDLSFGVSLPWFRCFTSIIDQNGAFKKLLITENSTFNGTDELENFYFADEEGSPDRVVYLDKDTSYVYFPLNYGNSGHSFTKLNRNGVVWSLPQVFENIYPNTDRENRKLWISDSIIHMVGYNFSYYDSIYSTDGFVHENGIGNGKGVLIQYDTAGRYNWHYMIEGVDHNTNIRSGFDQNLNSYYAFSNIEYGQSLELRDTANNVVMYEHDLISLDVNGNVRFDLNIHGSIPDLGYRVEELEVKDEKIELAVSFRNYYGDSIRIESAQNPTVVFSTNAPYINDYNECFLYTQYDTSGNLLNYTLYEDTANTFFFKDRVVPENSTVDGSGNIVYETDIGQGAVWNNTYYPRQQDTNGYYENGQHLIVSSLNDSCSHGSLILNDFDTLCFIDSTSVQLSTNFSPYNNFLPNNQFIIHYSDTNVFANLSTGDTVGTNLSNLNWNFNFSNLQPDTLWVRIESTHPSLFSNVVPIIFSQPLDNSFFSLNACVNDSLELMPDQGASYIWWDEFQNQVSTSDTFLISVADTSVFYDVEVTNVCNQSWFNTFEIIPNQYDEFNTDSVLLCPNIETDVSFLPNYDYQMNSNLAVIDSVTYTFQFVQDTLIEYELTDSSGCEFNDSILFSMSEYNASNTDSVSVCPDVETQVSFLPNYSYIMNGYTSTIDSLNYTFQFNEDTLIEYDVVDSLGCLFNDSIQFFSYSIQIPNLALIGPPWEITVTNNFESYFWYSNLQFNYGSDSSSIFPGEEGGFHVDVTDSNGCVTSNSYYFSDASIQHLISENINIYPNPVDDVLKISGDEGRFDMIKVISSQGRTVYSSKFTTSINTSQLRPGAYLIELSNESIKLRYPFLKK